MVTNATRSIGAFSKERAQLERLLADPLFSQSKRYSSFLRYVTERALSGSHEPLTERTLGVDVFGRSHHYDTEADPIVRVTASELRKRLAHYYDDPAHSGELRVVIRKQSYEAEFVTPDANGSKAEASPAELIGIAPAAVEPVHRKRHWLYAATALAACLLLTGLVRVVVRPQHSASELFWAPLTEGAHDVLLSFPEFSDHVHLDQGAGTPKLSWSDVLTPTPDPMQVSWEIYARRLVHVQDLAAVTRMSEFLGSKGKHAIVKGEHDLTMGDLRESPAVVLGGLTNQWTGRLSSQFRFSFGGEGTLRFVRDSQHPANRQWSFDAKVPSGDRVKDYIIISRVTDSVSGHVTVLAGGFSVWGTEAAVELLSDPIQMEKVLAQAPKGWNARNVQIVLEATVVNRQAGMPRLLATHSW